jgi:uncharacterized protein
MSDDDTPERDSTAPSSPDEPAHDPEILQLSTQAFDCARQGDTDRLAAYVDAGVPVDLTTDRGDSLLMLAAYHGHADTVRALLDRHAETDRVNEQGQTPLAGAVFKDAREVVTVLVEAGADPEAGAPSAVETATMFGMTEMLELLDVG